MVGVRTIASLVGILAGLWAIGGTVADGLARNTVCSTQLPCPSPPGPNVFVLALAGLLILTSLVCLFGPSVVFYASAVLSVLLGASMVLDSNLGDPVVEMALGLAAASFVLSVVAARKRVGISEQSNPMNLPVFG